MALPNPFNSVADLMTFSAFKQGTNNDRQSVLDGSFAFSQFEKALANARREIYRRAGRKENNEYEDDRKDELTEAELYLATAILYPNYAARMAIKFPESNLQSVGETMSGADTPSPYEKQERLMKMRQQLRAIGLELLQSPTTRYAVEVAKIDLTRTYPALSSY